MAAAGLAELRPGGRDRRARFDDGPTAYLVVHFSLAVVSMTLGLAVVVLGVRAWRRGRG